MFGNYRMLKVSGAIAIAASIAVIASPSALGARKHAQACKNAGTIWVIVTGDEGVQNLEPRGQAACIAPLACTSVDEAASSPNPGWVSVTDDLGVPWLYPAALSRSADRGGCTSAPAAAPAADAARAATSAAAPSQPILRSPYPGWVLVPDDTGVLWLEPVTQAGS